MTFTYTFYMMLFPFMLALAVIEYKDVGKVNGVTMLFLFASILATYMWLKERKEKKKRDQEWEEIKEMIGWMS